DDSRLHLYSGTAFAALHSPNFLSVEQCIRAIGRAYERAGSDFRKAQLACLRRDLLELRRLDVAFDLALLARRPQILPDGEKRAPGRAHVGERVADLRARLAQPQHDSGLYKDASAVLPGNLFGAARTEPQNVERA